MIVYCQSADVKKQNNDTLASAKSSFKKSLYFGAGFGSNFIYLGSSISSNKPYYSTAVIFEPADGLFISSSVSHINKTNPFIAFYSVSGSYRHTVNSWFDYAADLSYYVTPKSLHETLFNNFALINLTTGFDWKLIYTKLIISGLHSNSNSGYIQLRNSHYFSTPSFFKGSASLSFDPNVNLLFGRLVRIETTTGPSRFGNAPPFVQLKKKQTTTTTTYSYIFSMMDTEFSVPVTLNFTNFSIEAEPVYILPAYSNSDYPAPKGFSLNITAYFRIL
jgi:hypothetical protein